MIDGLQVATHGEGPPVLLLHGWPNTWFVWHRIAPLLRHRVIMPDLRGLGGSTGAGSYDLHTLADDAAAILDALDVSDANVVGHDLGVGVAWMIASRHPSRVRTLTLFEGLLGTLPGAEHFARPWWFGFHDVPGLAEAAVAGNEAAYIGWFLRTLGPEDRAVFVEAYRAKLGLAHYRAMKANAALIDAAARPNVPTLAIAGGVVGDAIAKQLAPITAHLQTTTIERCAHIIQLEQPQALADALAPFLR
jgi:pimeloyl-ACP methyl ester carboxylesterase